MTEIIIRDGEGDDPLFAPPWDTVWPDLGAQAFADWLLADPDNEPNNIGGFQAINQLATAMLLCLGTNKRRPDWQKGGGSVEIGGWHGDSFDIDTRAGERAIGSLLWRMQREILSDDLIRQAIAYVKDALQTLIDQRAVYDFDVSGEMDKPSGRATLSIRAYDVSGQTIFENSFPFIGS